MNISNNYNSIHTSNNNFNTIQHNQMTTTLNNFTEEDEDLRCPVCNHFFSQINKPFLLPCNHNLCLKCIEGVKAKKMFFCPFCRSPFDQEQKFNVNYSFLNLILKILKHKTIFCKNCKRLYQFLEHYSSCDPTCFVESTEIFSEIKELIEKCLSFYNSNENKFLVLYNQEEIFKNEFNNIKDKVIDFLEDKFNSSEDTIRKINSKYLIALKEMKTSTMYTTPDNFLDLQSEYPENIKSVLEEVLNFINLGVSLKIVSDKEHFKVKEKFNKIQNLIDESHSKVLETFENNTNYNNYSSKINTIQNPLAQSLNSITKMKSSVIVNNKSVGYRKLTTIDLNGKNYSTSMDKKYNHGNNELSNLTLADIARFQKLKNSKFNSNSTNTLENNFRSRSNNFNEIKTFNKVNQYNTNVNTIRDISKRKIVTNNLDFSNQTEASKINNSEIIYFNNKELSPRLVKNTDRKIEKLKNKMQKISSYTADNEKEEKYETFEDYDDNISENKVASNIKNLHCGESLAQKSLIYQMELNVVEQKKEKNFISSNNMTKVIKKKPIIVTENEELHSEIKFKNKVINNKEHIDTKSLVKDILPDLPTSVKSKKKIVIRSKKVGTVNNTSNSNQGFEIKIDNSQNLNLNLNLNMTNSKRNNRINNKRYMEENEDFAENNEETENSEDDLKNYTFNTFDRICSNKKIAEEPKKNETEAYEDDINWDDEELEKNKDLFKVTGKEEGFFNNKKSLIALNSNESIVKTESTIGNINVNEDKPLLTYDDALNKAIFVYNKIKNILTRLATESQDLEDGYYNMKVQLNRNFSQNRLQLEKCLTDIFDNINPKVPTEYKYKQILCNYLENSRKIWIFNIFKFKSEVKEVSNLKFKFSAGMSIELNSNGSVIFLTGGICTGLSSDSSLFSKMFYDDKENIGHYKEKDDSFSSLLMLYYWDSNRYEFLNMPHKRAYHSSYFYNNKLYIVGGASNFTTSIKDCVCFNNDNKTWELLPPLNQGRSQPSLCIYNDNILYSFRGYNQELMKCLDSIEWVNLETMYFNPKWNIFVPEDPGMVWAKAFSSSAIVVNESQIFIFGGSELFKNKEEYSKQCFIFNPLNKNVYRSSDLFKGACFSSAATFKESSNSIIAIDSKNEIGKSFSIHSFCLDSRKWKFIN